MRKKIISKLLVLAMSVSLFSGVAQPAIAADAVSAAAGETSLADGQSRAAQEQRPDIQNDIFWQDTDGNTIYSQGGGIFKFDDTYYWYGVKYEEAVEYAKNPSKEQKTDTFAGVTCYSSKDLVTWKYEGLVVTRDEVSGKEDMNNQEVAWVGRLGVAKVNGKYALFVQHECADADNSLDGNIDTDKVSKQVLVLTSDTPTGEFKWHQRINMNPYTGGTPNSGDQTVFTDDDGTSYLVYSYGEGRGKIFLSKIVEENGKIGLAKSHMVYNGAGREGNCMFKYKNNYYVCGSDLFGWNASHAYYLKLESLEDSYLDSFSPVKKMTMMDGSSEDFCHVTQTGFFYTVKGSEQETVLFCGDRWADFAGNGLGYNQWCPLSFKADGTPCFNSLSAWNLDIATGKWTVDASNNYVKNASFDADRKGVPYEEKTGFKQPEIAGWKHTVNVGNAPINNNNNTTTGKYALQLGDSVDFDCKISQVIAQNKDTADAVELPNGIYDLSAKIKNSGSFETLSMFAQCGDDDPMELLIDQDHAEYTEITLPDIEIYNNEVTVGFIAIGAAKAYAYIDDVTLVRSADQRAADAAMDLIKNIGTVDASEQSKAKIDAAQEAFDKLSTEQKQLVTNANTLKQAQTKYEEAVREEAEARKKVDISQAAVADIPAQVYSGKELTPAVTVTYNGTKLTNNTDYTLRYSNNLNIGTATVTITGAGKYQNSVNKTFAITFKKNGSYTVGNYKYKITNAKTNGTGTVTVTGGKNKNLKSVTLSATVKIGGKNFKITSIGKNAFKGYKNLTSVTVGKNVTKIENSAFEKCAKLKTIKINAAGLNSVGKNAIKGINAKAAIKCPKKQLAKYKKLFKSSTGYKKTMKIKK